MKPCLTYCTTTTKNSYRRMRVYGVIPDDKQLRQYSNKKFETDGRRTIQVTAAQSIWFRHSNVAREGSGQASTSRTLVRRRIKRRLVDTVLESAVGQRRSSGHQLHSGKAGIKLDNMAKGVYDYYYYIIGISFFYAYVYSYGVFRILSRSGGGDMY